MSKQLKWLHIFQLYTTSMTVIHNFQKCSDDDEQGLNSINKMGGRVTVDLYMVCLNNFISINIYAHWIIF